MQPVSFMLLALLPLNRPGSGFHPKQRSYALAAGAIFVGAALFELGRIVLGVPWPTMPANVSHGAGVVLSALWLAAAVSLVLRDRKPRLLTLSFVLSLAGSAAMLVHGAVTRVFGSLPGTLYIVVAVVTFALLKSSFDRGYLQTGIDASRWARST